MPIPDVSHCFIPLAGFGSRLHPITQSIPKEMFPINKKPIIQYIIEESLKANCQKFTYLLNKDLMSSHIFKDYLTYFEKTLLQKDTLSTQNSLFQYINQSNQRGLGVTILDSEEKLSAIPFIVSLADMLTDPKRSTLLTQMKQLYQTHRCTIIGLQSVPKAHQSLYGIVEGIEISPNVYQLSNMIEKPKEGETSSSLAAIGRYLLTPTIFDALKITASMQQNLSDEFSLTDALRYEMQHNKVIGIISNDTYFDCGQWSEYVAAINYFIN